MFSLRIVSTSHYQAEPIPDLDVTYSSFRSSDVKRVPILRIFGATPAGQKTCMHVHGVFPYLYVPYDGTQPVDSYLRRFAASLDKAISVANNTSANNQHVFKISLVSGIPMYGYHADEQQFLKIYMYNPNSIRKAADLLLGGAVMNKSFQPHEAHIPFPLQLFIDYNLYGMNLINAAAIKFRRSKKDKEDGRETRPSTSHGGGDTSFSSSPGEGPGSARTPFMHSLGSSCSSSTPCLQHWDVSDLPSELLLPPSVERQSVCELEVDIVAADILNRREVTDNIGGNPGLAALWEDERQRRRDAGQTSQITPQESQEHGNVEASDSEKQLMERLAEIIQQHRALRRSESEESSASVEDSIVSQGDVSCIPASQLENHSVTDSEGLTQSQDTVIMVEDEDDNAPIISLDSIQRVVSFSQSFSRPSSQSTVPAGDDEAADRSLVEVLAALAEDGSPPSSQHSATQIAALEEQDSIMGHDVPLPPDDAALLEDEEETLQMSQVVPEEEESDADRGESPQDRNANFDLEGLDATWNGSSDSDCVMRSDEEEADEAGDIPQLDGTSDQKPVSGKSSKKRLGVRGPILSAGSSGGGAGTSSGDQGVTSPGPQPFGNFPPPAQQAPGGFPQSYPQQQQQQWGNDGRSGMNVMGRPPHSSPGWPQSPAHHGHYPAMYGQQPGEGYGGYFPYPHPQPFSGPSGSGGMQSQFSPNQPTFSSPPCSPMSPPYGPSMQGFPQPAPFAHSQARTSPQHPGPVAQPQAVAGSQPGMAAMRRHSVGSVTPSPQHGPGALGWPFTRPGFGTSEARVSPSGALESWSSYPGSLQNQGDLTQEPSHQPSELQALLEAPSTSSTTAGTASGSSSSAAPLYRRTMSADCGANSGSQSVAQPPPVDFGAKSSASFKLPEKRSSSFSGPSMSAGSALTSLYNLVSNVDPSARTPTPTSTITPSSTPNSAPSPGLQIREDEPKSYTNLSSAVHKTSPLFPSCQPPLGRSLSVEEPPTSLPPPSAACGQIPAAGEDKTSKPGESQGGEKPPVAAPQTTVSSKNERLGKQAKMKKLGLSLQRNRPSFGEAGGQSCNTHTPCLSYTYTFHVPTPVFKRLKLQGVFPSRSLEEVKVVRMHPMDARRYSLLKIGRELVKITCLSPRQVANVCNALSSHKKSSSPAQTLLDPHRGEVLSSEIAPQSSQGESDIVIMQSSRITGTSRRMISGRLLGPKCKRKKTIKTEGSTQTVSLSSNLASDLVQDDKTSSQSDAGSETMIPVSGDTVSQLPQSDHAASGSGHNGVSPSGDNQGQWPGPHMKDMQQVQVKQEYPPQSPTAAAPHHHQWGSNTNLQGTWAHRMAPGVLGSGQWPGPGHGSWQMGRYGDWNRDPQMAGSGEGFCYPPTGKESSRGEEKPLHSTLPFRYPHPSWSASSPSSVSSQSVSSSQSYPMSSPSTTTGQSSSFSYPPQHSHSYNPYSPAHYNQSPPYSASGGHSPVNPSMSVSKFMPGAYPAGYHSAASQHHQFHAGPGGGQNVPQSHQQNPQYTVSTSYPGGQHRGYMSPTNQQSNFGMGSSAPSFPSQRNGTFSPPVSHSSHMSPAVSNYGQISPPANQHSPLSPPASATIDHRPQFFPPGPNPPGHFSPPLHSQGQFPVFPGQQGHFPNQVSGSPFPQPTPDSNSGNFHPQSHCPPSTSGNFLPSANQQQPFLMQGACRDTIHRVADPSKGPTSLQGSADLRPDRPPSSTGPDHSVATSGSPSASEQPLTSGEDHLPADTKKPSYDIVDILNMSEKRSKLKQTPTGFCTFQDYPEEPLTLRKKSSRKDKTVAYDINQKKFSGGTKKHGNKTEKIQRKLSGKKPKVKIRGKFVEGSDGEDVNLKGSGRKKENMEEEHRSDSDITTNTAFHNRRRTSVELMSQFDSDDDFDDESDDSFDDYRPGRKIQGAKRKRSDKIDSRRSKRTSVNYGRNAFSQFLEGENEEKIDCKGHRKNSKHKRKKQERLIEGVHYIVVGKFKGHRIMLVKVNKVKVTLNERVNVSEWSEWSFAGKDQGEGSIVQTFADRKRVIGACQQPSNEFPSKPHRFSSNVQKDAEQEVEDAEGFVSDASTIIDENESPSRNLLDSETTEGNTEIQTSEQKSLGAQSVAQILHGSDGSNEKEKCQQTGRGHGEMIQHESEQEVGTGKNLDHVFSCSDDFVRKDCETKDSETFGGCDEKSLGTPTVLAKPDESEERQEKAAAQDLLSSRNESVEKRLQQECKESVLNILTADPAKHHHHKDGSMNRNVIHEAELETATLACRKQSKSAAEEESREKAAAAAAAAARAASETPRSVTPVSKPGKLLIDSPSVVYQSSSGEHSQDADCSSLPHSNPDSNSSSPVFPRISFSHNLQSNSRDFELCKSESKHLEQRDSEEKCPGSFCFQISHKVKETCKPLQDLDDSSDSTDSNACFSDGPAFRDDVTSTEPVALSRKKKLTKLKAAETEKDKLKRQKKLTPNQRLGVAFLSKKRKKVKSKGPVQKARRPTKKGKGEDAESKLMNSLSVLHMATLASLEESQTAGDDSSKFTESIVKVSENSLQLSESIALDNIITLNMVKKETSVDSCGKSGGVSSEGKLAENIISISDLVKRSANMLSDDSCRFVDHSGTSGEKHDQNSGDSGKVTENDDIDVNEIVDGDINEVVDEAVDKDSVDGSQDGEETVVSKSSDVTNESSEVVSVNSAQQQIRPNPRTRKHFTRRKRSLKSKKPSKLMNSLSLLHMATLANLEDQPVAIHKDTSLPRACDAASDESDKYQDSLLKMSYISPVDSDKGDASPPVPLTPEELRTHRKEHKRKSSSISLRLEENLGTCAVRVSELRADSSKVGAVGSQLTHQHSGPQSSPYRSLDSKTVSDSDSGGSVLSDTIPHISLTNRQQCAAMPKADQLREKDSLKSQTEHQPSRVLAEKTNHLAEFASNQESINLKGMVSKSSAYSVSNMSIRDLFASAQQPDVCKIGENAHPQNESEHTDMHRYKGEQTLESACGRYDGHKTADGMPLSMSNHTEISRDVASPGRTSETGRKCDWSGFQSTGSSQNPGELGMSRTERIITQMLGFDCQQGREKPSPTSGHSPSGQLLPSTNSPRGHNSSLSSFEDKDQWRQLTKIDVHKDHKDLSARAEHSSMKWPVHQDINAVSCEDYKGSRNGLDNHFTKTPGRSPVSLYDYSGKPASFSPGRYAVSPRTLDEHSARHFAVPPSKYALSPRSIDDEQFEKHYSTSPGRNASICPGGYATTLPGKYASISPGRYTSASLSRCANFSPGRFAGKDEYSDRYAGFSPGRSGGTSPRSSDFHADRFTALSPKRHGEGFRSSWHTGTVTYTSPSRHSPRGLEDYAGTVTFTSPSKHSPRSTGDYAGTVTFTSPSKHSPRSTGDYAGTVTFTSPSIHSPRSSSTHSPLSPGRHRSGLNSADAFLAGKASAVSPGKSSVRSPGRSPASSASDGKESLALKTKQQRSIGDYLDEMIESTFAQLTPGMERKAQPKFPDPVGATQRNQHSLFTDVRSLSLQKEVETAFGSGKGIFGGGTSLVCSDTAIDLSAPKNITSVGNTVVTTIAKTTSVISHPTWTTVKTDDFENITDDEDDVIPSSQEYSANIYRFPGFRKLSSCASSSWSLYASQGKSSFSKHVSDINRERANSSSQENLNTFGSSSSSQSMYRNYMNSTAKSSVASSFASVHSSLSMPLSLVTSYGTQWQDSQVQNSAANTSIMSNFEPITDSEDEEPAKSPPKSAYSQHGAISSSWFPQISQASYCMAELNDTSVCRKAADFQQAPAYSEGGPSVLSQPSVTTDSSTDGHREVADCAHAALSSAPAAVSMSASPVPTIKSSKSSESASSIQQQPTQIAPSFKCTGNIGDRDSSDGNPEDGGGKKRKKTAAAQGPQSDSGSVKGTTKSVEGSGQPGRSPVDPPQHPDDTPGNGGGPGGSVLTAESALSRPCLVLCPKALPPTGEQVVLTAVSHGLAAEPATPAFCSNPADLPGRPRELGGRVLRVGTNRVGDLEEVAAPAGITGLREWQTLLAADSDVLPSQVPSGDGTVSRSLRDRLDREPQLHCLLAGDVPCIITPVQPPPSSAAVCAWIEEKLRSLATRANTAKSAEIQVHASHSEHSSSDEEEASHFTRLREGAREDVKDGETTIVASPTQAGDGRNESPAKRPRLDSDGMMHSTPVRRTSTEQFEPGCTPIAATDSPAGTGGGNREGPAREEFATPKRLPLRRLSTNTQSALRRAIQPSQSAFEGLTSQIDGPTPKNPHGFRLTQHKLQDAKALHKHQFLTVLSLELHADTRGDLMPDPEVDSIRVVFYSILDDVPPEKGARSLTGAIVVDAESCRTGDAGSSPGPSSSSSSARAGAAGPKGGRPSLLEKCGVQGHLEVSYASTEAELLQQVVQLVVRLDPDILLGFEVQRLSWGFLLQRAAHLSVNLCAQIARIQGSKQGNRFRAERDEWGADYTSEIHIEGRIILNLWRVLKHEVTLNIYSYENCAFHILHSRVPAYSFRTLTSWYNHRTNLYRWRVIGYYVERVKGQLAMLDQLDIIGKTSEFSRVFGIEFFDVLSRGSQYRVESMMLRLAKPLNFIPVSPSVQQRARQKAPECIPLTLEPESRFYVDPLVVLDFQSLYPSIMIAYNYCFSTCLGRLGHLAGAHEGPIEFGCTSLNIPAATLRKLRKDVTISPNGCVFVTQRVRRGVLPMMVEEILKTRLMVKKSMKDYKDDKTLYRMLDARQLGLKLIANVTYGYTGASFSGRMPCIEVGDSIVRKARESLERAIHLVEETTRWQARVVYGDTDSLFILLPGRTKDQAFLLGQEIADAVSDMFPKPMKLKFEKVYLPCVLQTKKRYVGFMYETRDQQQPVFDAKGIETVRRDNCGVVSKVLEKCIKTLFVMRDVSLVRAYLQRQFTKMLCGRVGLQDYIFAKEYRGMMGYKPGACVPALEIAKRRLKDDRRAEPRVGERVPYVIVHGSPGLPLIQLVRQPGEVLRDSALRINVVYYITKQVLPPLDRLLGLIGVSVFQWYSDMPKVVRMAPSTLPAQDTKQGIISQYFVTSDCLVCERQTKQPVCSACAQDRQLVAVTLASRSATWEAVHQHLAQVCFTCMGVQDGSQPCVSLDCPVLFRRRLADTDLTRADQQREALHKALAF